MIKLTIIAIITLTLFGFSMPDAYGIGIIVPKKPEVAPPVLDSVNVSSVICNHIARTRIKQVFSNSGPAPVEADYFFPVPTGSSVTDFVLYMDGKLVKGEVLGSDEARQIYRDIVRKIKDPGLVEWSEENLFRVRIFPIPAHETQTVEIEITEPLSADQGYYRFRVPHNSISRNVPGKDLTTQYTVIIEDTGAVRNVYSPTHKIDTVTSGSNAVVVTSKDPFAPASDFVLYYEASDADIAVSLLTHRVPGEDGFFSLRISPPWSDTTTAPVSGDFVFVIDTSGSMADANKIEQARKALTYCVDQLHDNQKFALVRFSTSVGTFRPELQVATEANKTAAKAWIRDLVAKGGTNISSALAAGLKYQDMHTSPPKDRRLFTVVFITDGIPTVGETSADKIAKGVLEKKAGSIRIFSFGVGPDVNTQLLDTLSAKTRAASDYVAPSESMEVPVSRFFDKVSRPALYDLKLEIPAVGMTDLYPPTLPDMFYGSDLTIIGRYKNAAHSSIVLSGSTDGTNRQFTFEKNFPVSNPDNVFVGKLWATRKIAWLLDQVRATGESDEVRTEIEELGRKFAIVTPYTSYLAVDDNAMQDRPQAASAPSLQRSDDAFIPARAASEYNESYSLHYKSTTGEGAVRFSERLNSMKRAEQTVKVQHAPVSLLGRTFSYHDGTWKDDALCGKATQVIKIKYLSDLWFHLAETYPELKGVLGLGPKIHIGISSGTMLTIGDDGTETIDVTVLNEVVSGLGVKK